MSNIQHKLFCSTCKDTQKDNLHKNCKYRLKDGTFIQKYMCRNCGNKRFKKWYSKNIAKFNIILRKSEKKFPEKLVARQLLAYAIKQKLIIKPKKCQKCGIISNRIQGHHFDYAKPLDVYWVCSLCHGKYHH